MALANDFRPNTFDDVVGQERVIRVLQQFAENVLEGRVKQLPGLFFHGPSGVGKTTLARLLAAELNDGFTGDYIEIDGGTSGNVEGIRTLAAYTNTGHRSHTRVICIDECHAMSREAFAALLKQLEEPQQNVLYILVTTNPTAVPETVKSRCLPLYFEPVPDDLVAARIAEIMIAGRIKGTGAGVTALAERSNGNVRDAIMKLEEAATVGDITADLVEDLWPAPLVDFGANFITWAQQGDSEAAMAGIRSAFEETLDTNTVWNSIYSELSRLSIAATTSEGSQRLSRLITRLWEFRIGLRNAKLTDPIPVEGYWWACCEILGAGKQRKKVD